MHRFKAKGISSRVFSKPQWVNPKDRITQWNIVTGDKVKKKKRILTWTLFFLTFCKKTRLLLLQERTKIPLVKSSQ
jgi:hypothetical protein